MLEFTSIIPSQVKLLFKNTYSIRCHECNYFGCFHIAVFFLGDRKSSKSYVNSVPRHVFEHNFAYSGQFSINFKDIFLKYLRQKIFFKADMCREIIRNGAHMSQLSNAPQFIEN